MTLLRRLAFSTRFTNYLNGVQTVVDDTVISVDSFSSQRFYRLSWNLVEFRESPLCLGQLIFGDSMFRLIIGSDFGLLIPRVVLRDRIRRLVPWPSMPPPFIEQRVFGG